MSDSSSLHISAAQISAERSGQLYADRIARYFFLALEEVMGRHGLDSTLKLARLDRYVREYPADTLDAQVDFAVLSALNRALDEMYGTRGGRGMALRAGRAWLVKGFSNFGALAGVDDPAYRRLSPDERVRVSLKALATVFSQFTDQACTLEIGAQVYRFVTEDSAFAWGQTSDKPVCQPLVGLLQETTRRASNGREYMVREIQCRAAGAESCIFTINRQSTG